MFAWAWGANSYGQLGLGNCHDLSEPNQIKDFPDVKLSLVRCGGRHSILITKNGHILSCGCNDNRQLGLLTPDHCINFTPVSLMLSITVKEVACGWDFTIALDNNGHVYSWGSNTYGQLGLSDIREGSDLRAPIRIKEFDSAGIIKIGAGLRHAAAISNFGEVWIWGDSKKGQNPLNANNTKTQISLSREGKSFIDVVCGSYHTLILSSDGEVFGWGDNKRGQLTHDPKNHPTLKVSKLDTPKVKAIATGWTHVLAITENYKILSWGRGDYGQLGRACEDSHGYDFRPTAVKIPGRVTEVCCGAEHSFAITEDGAVFSWGWNEHGMCGNGTLKNVQLPTKINILSGGVLKTISSGAGHSFCYSRD